MYVPVLRQEPTHASVPVVRRLAGTSPALITVQLKFDARDGFLLRHRIRFSLSVFSLQDLVERRPGKRTPAPLQRRIDLAVDHLRRRMLGVSGALGFFLEAFVPGSVLRRRIDRDRKRVVFAERERDPGVRLHVALPAAFL